MLVSAATLLAFAALGLDVAPRASGYADGAPSGFSGGFGEPSCHACHFHAALNSGPGRVTIAGVPDRFKPGEQYPLTITLTRPDMKLGGFQLTARFKDGGAQAGSLAPDAGELERLRIDVRSGVRYVQPAPEGHVGHIREHDDVEIVLDGATGRRTRRLAHRGQCGRRRRHRGR